MNEFNVGVVIPCSENRLDNLKLVLQHLKVQTFKPRSIVIVCDGFPPSKVSEYCGQEMSEIMLEGIQIQATYNEKHVAGSGTIQPKNAGAWWFDNAKWSQQPISHLWFIDSDIIVSPTALEEYWNAEKQEFSWHEAAILNERIQEPRIMIGPYEWLPIGRRQIDESLHNDPRGTFFKDFDPSYTSVGEINFALANFGGNIVYPRQAFKDIGGFWDDLSAGRVEDGEIGLRCASVGIPMCAAPNARGWHLEHPVNHQWKLETNEREVPMLNERHPWVQQEGIYVSDNDGKRFEWIDPNTGIHHNTLEIWEHYTNE